MEFFKNTNYNFIGNRNKAFIFSGFLFLFSIIALAVRGGPNLSIDFTGGSLLLLKFEKPVTIEENDKISAAISSLKLGSPEIKKIGANGDEIQIIVKATEKGTGVSDKIIGVLKTNLPSTPFIITKAEVVGPKVGSELGKNAIWAMLLAMIVVIIYVGLRFNFPYGFAAVIALFHDVPITLGIFALFNWEISLPIIAALLTLIGYSLNDTIVVFDRIRETTKSNPNKLSLEDLINRAVNQTLSRTFNTSFTTLMTVVAIYATFFNTEDVLKYFAITMIIGITIGTYSSIFIASPVLIAWNNWRPIDKKQEEITEA